MHLSAHGAPDDAMKSVSSIIASQSYDRFSRQYSILCVDDDLVGLEMRASVLEAEGYSVKAVCCPLMALKYNVSMFHLAVIDFDMPGLNGFQLLLRLRTARATFPIVLLSSKTCTLPGFMRRVFSSCLDKEEPIHRLLDTVHSYLTAIPDPPECQVSRETLRRPLLR